MFFHAGDADFSDALNIRHIAMKSKKFGRVPRERERKYVVPLETLETRKSRNNFLWHCKKS